MPQTHSDARAALDSGDAEEALKVARRALEERWTTDLARTAGIAAFRSGQFETAESHFAEVTKADPEDAIATYYRGLCRERLGHPKEALTHYRTAHELDPDLEEAADKIAKLSDEGDAMSRKRMTEFGLPGTEEEVSEYQRRTEEKRKADIRAQWHGQPTARKAFSVVVILALIAAAAWLVHDMIAFDMP